MIGYLQGTALRTSPGSVLLDVRGVGYELNISLATYYELQRAGEGVAVGLFVHTHLREDLLALYGFWTEREKEIFLKLITVTGIGPRLAQTVLSGMPPEDLAAALSAADVRHLVTIPGIGKKTAERMVVELRDKVKPLPTAKTAQPVSMVADVVAALVNLGYKAAEAERAVEAVSRKSGADLAGHERPVTELLRASLKALSKVG